MFCNSYLVLASISIILIISILILILYKNHKDSKITTKTNNNVESFYVSDIADDTLEDTIVNNNQIINDYISELDTVLPQANLDVLYKEDPEEIDRNLQTIIQTNINKHMETIKDLNIVTDGNLNDNISKLTNQITDLENVVNKLNLNKIKKQNYTKIKSLNNGQELALSQTPNTKFNDPKTGIMSTAYMINMNNGCLSVGPSDYNIYKCNDKNQKHLFKMEHIINEQSYENNIDKAFPFDNIDKTKINYPFTMIKSINNKNCLTNQNGNITVQPCYSFNAQRWMPL